MFLLILFAFMAGFVTILSPCILPVLPIVLSGSLTGGKKRPLGIVTGFIGSFTFFTLFLSAIVRLTGLPADFLRNTAIILILVFGIFLVIPQAQLIFEKLISKLSSLQKTNTTSQTGFWGGVLVGTSLGLVWAPCVGPILASVITLSITSQVGITAFLITLSYSLGTAIPMLFITYSGKAIFSKVPWLLDHTTQIQQFFGVIMIFTSLALFNNLDLKFQSYILTTFPNYGVGLTKFEDNSAVQRELNNLQNLEPTIQKRKNNPDDLLLPSGNKAPGFQNEQSWINSQPLNLETDLKGKVVLVDFWTYTCINCIRTLPYLADWYKKYNELGFEIVGVHSPEFEFEKETQNVIEASKQYNLTYPIVQDNNFLIWKAFNNRYWPAHYLIDKNGDIRYTHFGEGKYLETENAIRALLDEEALDDEDTTLLENNANRKKQTPEIYLGYQRAQNYLVTNKIEIDKPKTYQPVSEIAPDGVALSGNWTVEAERIVALDDTATLELNFLASNVYLVLSPAENNDTANLENTITVTLDGKPLPSTYFTKDMNSSGVIKVTQPDKYDIITLGQDYGRHRVKITFSKGVSAFAFTFGS